MSQLELTFASGETSLVVHHFSVREAVSSLFEVSVRARSESPAVDLQAIVGQPAALTVTVGYRFARAGTRMWKGVVRSASQVRAVTHADYEGGLSTYELAIVPTLWLLGQRRNYRVFQHLAVPDIVTALLDEWSVEHTSRIDRGRYPKLEYRVQYGETDYAFVCRLLEEAGIAFTFPDEDGAGAQLVLGDALERAEARPGHLTFVDEPSQAAEKEFVTGVRLAHAVRPGAYTVRDHDFRNPAFALFGEAKAAGAEERYEQYVYAPGAFLVEGQKGGGTPVADDKGVARHDPTYGDARAERLLLAERVGKRRVSFDTNAMDLYPGRVFSIGGHPHADVAESAPLLTTELHVEGSPHGEWTMGGQAVFADTPYQPPSRTPKPRVDGVQSATVVGPPGQEIHTDEFGRVRIQFPWDRQGKLDDDSSCWVRVSQGWAGTGFGMVLIPRVGQEVLVGFVEGDPDQPVIVGRVFNAAQQAPYKLPDHKTRSVLRSDSSPGSEGSNEIMFEDAKGSELVSIRAQRDLRSLVKNDETITVGRNRQKLVHGDELETTGGDLTEVTKGARSESTRGDRTTIVGGRDARRVGGDANERTLGALAVAVGGDHDLVITGVRRERVGGGAHLVVMGARNEKITGKASSTVGGDLHAQVAGAYAFEAGDEIHIKSGSALVIEAPDLTLKSGGGFIRIDAGGVTIQGGQVKVNSGGSAGSGKGASPDAPEDAREAVVDEAPNRDASDDGKDARPSEEARPPEAELSAGADGRFNSSEASSLDSRYGAAEHPMYVKPWEQGVMNPTVGRLNPGGAFDPSRLEADSSKTYVWLVNEQGQLVVGEEVQLGSLSRETAGHPTLLGGDASTRGRAAGELLYRDGQWVIDDQSGRFMLYPGRNTGHVHNAAELFKQRGLDVDVKTEWTK